MQTGIWHSAHHGDAYGAMLSLTVLPAELHFLSGVPDLLVFSVVYPAIGALLPVAVFGLARRVLSRRWAFAAATFVIMQEFQDLPALARQEIAMVLFAVLLAAMLDTRIKWPRDGLWLPCLAWLWSSRITLRPMLRLRLPGSCCAAMDIVLVP